MTHLLESTRNYLKSSTKIGRRLSSYRDDSRSASEASLHDLSTSTSTAPSSAESLKQQHRPTTHNRLSSLFSLEGRTRNSISSEDRAAANATPTLGAATTSPTGTILSSKIGPEQTNDITQKKRRSFHSRKSSQQPQEKHHRSSRFDMFTDGEVPRGRSPTLSVSPTDYSVTSGSSSYDARPSDYPSLKHYQAHVWRRNLLEESIMYSLKLGYGEARPRRPRSSSRPRSRSRSIKGSGRSRRLSRDQHSAMMLAMSKDLPPCPTGDGTVPVTLILTSAPSVSGKDIKKSGKNKVNNSPYQMLLNPSTTNITHSFASFTLELDEHQAPRVMASSAVPNLFSIKVGSSTTRQRGRANSTARMMVGGHGPTTRVLTGKNNLIDQENKDPRLVV
ncbi:hypothetical protein FBU30_004848 [Linnemannia zychae]|nr:hypothetical protein FBU30_004848 [Linnemannia zychae]